MNGMTKKNDLNMHCARCRQFDPKNVKQPATFKWPSQKSLNRFVDMHLGPMCFDPIFLSVYNDDTTIKKTEALLKYVFPHPNLIIE